MDFFSFEDSFLNLEGRVIATLYNTLEGNQLADAIITNNIRKFTQLLDGNLNLNDIKNAYGSPLTVLAIRSDRLPMLKILLERGVDVNMKDINNSTALHCAALHERQDCVELLLEYGADATILEEDAGEFFTALDFARMYNHTEIVEILERHVINEANNLVLFEVKGAIDD